MKTLIRLLTVSLLLSGLILPLVQVSPAAAATEDYTEWTESDAEALVTVNATRITFASMPRNTNTYVYKDYGENYFSGNFTHQFKARISSTNTNGGGTPGIATVWALANSVGTTSDMGARLSLDWFGSDTLYLRQGTGTSIDSATYPVIDKNKDLYIEVTRNVSAGTYGTLYAYICTGDYYSNNGTLADTIGGNLAADTDFRYLYSLAGFDDGQTYIISGYVENIDINETLETSEVHVITATSDNLSDYGLGYPVTYKFAIPETSTNLTAYTRHSTEAAWDELDIKTSSDFFNGVECVRFDYDEDYAYVSAAFDSTSENISIIFKNASDEVVETAYIAPTSYYDGRTVGVTSTFDDWNDTRDASFISGINMFQSYNVTVSTGIETQNCNATTWQHIQAQYDEGFVEPASHSQTHPHIPYDDYDTEIGGSHNDITSNLTLGSYQARGISEYVPAWIEPYGESDATAIAKIAEYNYLVSRLYDYGDDYVATWDVATGLYERVGFSIVIGDDANGTENVTVLNDYFDTVYAAGGMYHLFSHPYTVDWSEGEYADLHLEYISGKTDVWYVGFGAIYMYDFTRNNITHTTMDYSEGDTPSAPSAPTGFSATDGSSTSEVTLTWTASENTTGYYVYRDDVLIDTVGLVEVYHDTGATAGNITAGTATASNGSSNDYVTLSLAGEGTSTTTHLYSISAFNDDGVSANATDNGTRGVGSITYQWQRSAADSDASYSNLTGATTDPYNDTTAPATGDGRYYQCYVSATGAISQTSTSDRGFRGAPPVLASIGNQSVTVNTTLSFTISATGIGTISYGVLNNPAGSSINSTTGVFTWVPEATGTFSAVSFNATNEYGNDTENITITVSAAATSSLDDFTGYREILSITPLLIIAALLFFQVLNFLWFRDGIRNYGSAFARSPEGIFIIALAILFTVFGFFGLQMITDILTVIINE